MIKVVVGFIIGWLIGKYVWFGPDDNDDNPWDVWDDPWNLK